MVFKWYLNKSDCMRAFIFSLDAFVAFTIALVAVYSLIFFSSIPSSYYYLLTQGHYLARDTLFTLSQADCVTPYQPACDLKSGSVLDNIVFGDTTTTIQKKAINYSVGVAVPKQFGYIFEVSSDNGATWALLYNTSESGDIHAKVKRKLSVSSQVPVFDYSGHLAKDNPNPYYYNTCGGADGSAGGRWSLTCEESASNSFSAFSGGGGADSGGYGSGDIVPSTGIKLVRITIFI
jgi:uncharacterized membrane protein YgcG